MPSIWHHRFLYVLLALASIADNLSALLKEVLVADPAELKLAHLVSEDWDTDDSLESFHLIGLFLDDRHDFLDDYLLESKFFLRERFELGVFLMQGTQSGLIALPLLF
jgi:hypothetical protein